MSGDGHLKKYPDNYRIQAPKELIKEEYYSLFLKGCGFDNWNGCSKDSDFCKEKKCTTSYLMRRNVYRISGVIRAKVFVRFLGSYFGGRFFGCLIYCKR